VNHWNKISEATTPILDGLKKCLPSNLNRCFVKIAVSPANMYMRYTSVRRKKHIQNPALMLEKEKLHLPEKYRVNSKSLMQVVANISAIFATVRCSSK
jgi:hypothetical protein